MSFYMSRSGAVIDGSDANTFAQPLTLIPEGTTAIATIKAFEKKAVEGLEPVYEVTWKIIDDNFKNREVRQKIRVFDKNPEKVDKALNMLVRIFNICQFRPAHENEPTQQDLIPLLGKVCGIKIREWSMLREDNSIAEGNWVAEVHTPDINFTPQIGIKAQKAPPQTPQSALTRNAQRQTNAHEQLVDDELPF